MRKGIGKSSIIEMFQYLEKGKPVFVTPESAQVCFCNNGVS